jgi:hypothetical protein
VTHAEFIFRACHRSDGALLRPCFARRLQPIWQVAFGSTNHMVPERCRAKDCRTQKFFDREKRPATVLRIRQPQIGGDVIDRNRSSQIITMAAIDRTSASSIS